MVGGRLWRGGQCSVEHVQQVMVLPEAGRESEHERNSADDQSRAELVEMIDDAQSIFVTDRP
jgi:hypothetical protein